MAYEQMDIFSILEPKKEIIKQDEHIFKKVIDDWQYNFKGRFIKWLYLNNKIPTHIKSEIIMLARHHIYMGSHWEYYVSAPISSLKNCLKYMFERLLDHLYEIQNTRTYHMGYETDKGFMTVSSYKVDKEDYSLLFAAADTKIYLYTHLKDVFEDTIRFPNMYYSLVGSREIGAKDKALVDTFCIYEYGEVDKEFKKKTFDKYNMCNLVEFKLQDFINYWKDRKVKESE